MTPEQPPRDALRPLRPMPSIDVPLLRSERSAFRNKQLARWTIVGTVVAAVAGSIGVAAVYLTKRAPADETVPSAPDEQLPEAPLAVAPVGETEATQPAESPRPEP